MNWNRLLDDAILMGLHKRGKDDMTIAALMGFPIQVVAKNRERLGLTRNFRRIAPVLQKEPEPPVREKPNPVAMAEAWLGKRLKRTDNGFLLDGVPTKTGDVVKALNRILKAQGAEQVGPPQWREP